MASSKGIRAGRAYVELGTEDNPLTQGLKYAERRLANWGQTLQAIGGRMLAVSTPVIAAGVAATFSFATTGESLMRMSAATGATVEELSALDYAAQHVGSNLGAVGSAMGSLQRNMLAAREGSQDAQEAFTQLGLRFEDLLPMSTNERFRAVADGLSRMQSETVRADIASRLLGGSSAELARLLRGGTAEIDRHTARLNRMGGPIAAAQAAASEAFMETWRDILFMFGRIVGAIGSALLPALQGIATWVTQILPVVITWVQENRGLIVAIVAAAGVIAGLGIGLYALGIAASVASVAIGVLLAVGSALGVVIGAILSPIGLVVLGIGAAVAAVVTLTGSWGTLMAGFSSSLSWLGGLFGEVWGGIVAAIGNGDLKGALNVALLGAQILWVKVWGEIKLWFLGVWDKIVQTVDDSITTIKILWMETLGFLSGGLLDYTHDIADAYGALGRRTGNRNLAAGGRQTQLDNELATLQHELHGLTETLRQNATRGAGGSAGYSGAGGYGAMLPPGIRDLLEGARGDFTSRGTFSAYGAEAMSGNNTLAIQLQRRQVDILAEISRNTRGNARFA